VAHQNSITWHQQGVYSDAVMTTDKYKQRLSTAMFTPQVLGKQLNTAMFTTHTLQQQLNAATTQHCTVDIRVEG